MILFTRIYLVTPQAAYLRRIVRIYQNCNGQQQKREVFDGDFQLIRKIIFHYDGTMRLQSKESFGRQNVFSGKTAYQYSNDGRLKAINYTNAAGQVIGRRLWSFTDTGFKRVYRKLNEAGHTTQQIRFTYDSLGRIIHEAHYKSRGRLAYYKSFRYDAHSRETEVQIRTETGHLKARRVSVYNNKDQVLRQNWYDVNGLLQKRDQFSYHPDGALQSEQTEDFFARQTFMRQYDVKGRLLLQQHFANERLLEESVLTYDVNKPLHRRFIYVFPNDQRHLKEVQTTNLIAESKQPGLPPHRA